MKFKEYLEKANQMAEEHPECLEMECYYSRDDEGNGFDMVQFNASIGFLDDDGDMIATEDLEPGQVPNIVCIN